MEAVVITGAEIQKQVGHWLNTPVCGYLGSDYGQDVKALLHNPLSSDAPDAFLRKLRDDVPLLGVAPFSDVNLYSVRNGVDRLDLVIEVAGAGIAVPGGSYAD